MKYDLGNLLFDLGEEINLAVKTHGPLHSLHEAHSVILEEVEEFWDEVKINPKKLEPINQELRKKNIKKELIQIAAMCLRTLMDVEL